MSFYNIFEKQIEKEQNLEKNQENKPKIIIDYREKNSLVASELIHLGCEIEFKTLHIGDYIVKNILIERKTISDFINSMINKRLIKQMQNMHQMQNKLLIIEGIDEQEIYSPESGVNENAIRGFILSITLKYKIPIILTKDYIDTAKFLIILAKKREKIDETGINAKKKARDINEQMQYILEGFPGIGPKSAKNLLKELKTIKNIINADQKDLQKIIGKKSGIFKLVDTCYQ